MVKKKAQLVAGVVARVLETPFQSLREEIVLEKGKKK